MGLKIEPVVTESVAKQISETIRQAIVSGELKVDERLPTETELAERFQVSRPTIREALKRLAAQNLIRSRRGPSGGTFVNRPDMREVQDSLSNMTALLTTMGAFDLNDIAQAKRELEKVCVQLAFDHIQPHHYDVMRAEIALQKDDSLSGEEFCASDVRFHRALADATGNPMLSFVMAAVIEATQPIVNLAVHRYWDRRATVCQHEQIVAAIENRDLAAAQAAISTLMDDLEKRYQQAQAWRLAQG